MKSTFNRFSKNILPFYKTNKAMSIAAIAIIAIGGFISIKKIFTPAATNQYVLARASRGDIETTVAGTGQVAATNQIDIKAKVSGDITSVNAVAGQTMKAGQIIARIDSTDAYISLKNAQISLEKLTKPADQSSLLSSQNSLADAEQQKTDAEASVVKSYADAKISISTTYLDTSEIVSSVHDLFYDSSGFLNDTNTAQYSSSIRTSRDDAGVLFDNASQDIDAAQAVYGANVQTTDPDKIESLIDQTYTSLNKLADALKKAKLVTDSIKNTITNSQNTTAATTAQSNIANWTSKVNNHLSDLLAAKSAIKNAKNNVDSATRSIAQRKESLSDTVTGTDALDIESQRLNVQQKQSDLAKYTITAPFDGVLATLNVKKGDAAGSATIGTFITKQKVAEVSLNEIDAAKVEIGQPVTLTFDAVDGLTATGTVASIDLIGTVTQGVVNYTTKIAFDVQDDRIKPGMSVSATIVTSSKKDVLLVPSTAIKTRGNQTYVEVAELGGYGNASSTNQNFGSSTGRRMRNASSTASSTFGINASTTGTTTSSSTRPRRQFVNQTPVALATVPTEVFVKVGLSDNTQTEILEGLTEGQLVVSKTVSSTSTTKTTATTGSLFNLGGGGGAARATGGGGNFQRPAGR